MDQISPEFLPLCCRPRNGRFYEKRGVSGPSALLGPEMVKFSRNFCSCAVDLEMAVFNGKRAVSGPFLPFEGRNGSNFARISAIVL